MGSKQSKADKAARKAAKAAAGGQPAAPKKLTKKQRKRKAREDAARQKAEADTAAEDARLRERATAHRKERRELAKKLGELCDGSNGSRPPLLSLSLLRSASVERPFRPTAGVFLGHNNNNNNNNNNKRTQA